MPLRLSNDTIFDFANIVSDPEAWTHDQCVTWLKHVSPLIAERSDKIHPSSGYCQTALAFCRIWMTSIKQFRANNMAEESTPLSTRNDS
ncbi:hypothetical protein IG631_12203 [Alternaria alternata]|nr:hypothetical protein IG631_12203 [Alternaria alternata]